MGFHPINLMVRFLLEVSALLSAGMWGWKQSEGWLRFVLAIGIPIILAAVWGIFAVPNDPSRSGAAPVGTPGLVRLVIELAFFAFATWALYEMEYTRLGIAFGIVVLLHYIFSYERILWLISH